MKRNLFSSILLIVLSASLLVAGKDPEFKMVDGKVSVQAEAITLKQFLQYWDAATGMTSKVNPQLANEKISVRFEGLELNAAIRKSFQGQPWNWAIVNGKGINVIDRAAAVTATSAGPSSAPVQTFIEPRNDPPPPQPQQNTAFPPASGPVPAAATPAAPAAQPAGASSLPPSPGGPAPAPQTFQLPGTSLSAPLPTVQPGR